MGVNCRPQVRPGPAKSLHPPDVNVKVRPVVVVTLFPPDCILKMCKREGWSKRSFQRPWWPGLELAGTIALASAQPSWPAFSSSSKQRKERFERYLVGQATHFY